MQPMKTNSSDQNYKILRYAHVVFVLRKGKTATEFIALPGGTTDTDGLRIAQAAPSGDWREVKAINYDSIQSNTVPGAESHR